MTADIPRHLFRRHTELGEHVCADCVLGKTNEVHEVLPVEDVPERYEVETKETP